MTPASPSLAGNGPVALPKSEPVFDAENIELQRRMRFNPLRSLDPANLSLALDQFDLGILRQAAQLWDAMVRRDDTLSFVVPQLENSIAAKPWGVFKKKDADEKEAARHAAALEYFYGNVTAVDAFDRNVRGGRHLLLKQMGSSFAMRYAVHHFVWKPQPGKMIEVEGAAPVPALTAEMEHVPLWFFENVSGTLRFLPFGGFGIQGQPLNWEGEWMVTTGSGMMFAASICYVFKRLTFQDWTIYNERYAQNKVVGQTNARKDTEQGRAMAEIVANFNSDQGVVFYESQLSDKPPISLLGPQGTTSVDLFERFLDRQDRKMTVMFRGSDLRNMSREKEVVGVSAQNQETEALEIAHCQAMADACRTYIDRAVIRYCFGEDVEPLAYFGLPEMEQDDAKELRTSAGFLADRGAMVDLPTVAQRLGVTLTENPEDALKPIARRGAERPGGDAENAEEIARTENATRAARLAELVEEALRTGNNNPNHDTRGRFSAADSGGGFGGSDKLRQQESEIRANIQKGRNAMWKVLSDQEDVPEAMHRPDIGPIDFLWERQGRKGESFGLKHLLERRANEDHAVQSAFSPEETAERMVEVIARGTIANPDMRQGSIEIDHEGFRVILGRPNDKTNAWVVSGFEKRPDAGRGKKKGNR